MVLLDNIRAECHTLLDTLDEATLIDVWDILRAMQEPQANTSASEVFEGNQAQSAQLQEGTIDSTNNPRNTRNMGD